MNKEEEEVLVVKTEILFPDGVWDGFREFDKDYIYKVINENKSYLKRKFAETDSSWQQIIPQICLIVKDKIFVHKVPQTGSEGRLHEMWPIFLGGHVNSLDGGIDAAIDREFNEEILYTGKILKREFLGVVKLNSPEVNAVHTGLVWVFEGDTEEYKETEDDGVTDGKFISIKTLNRYINKRTYWSKIVAPYIIKMYS